MSDGMNKPNSEETGRLIDDEVKRIVDEQWERTYNLLSEKKDILEKLALQLLEKETIERQDLIECLGKFLKASTLIARVFFMKIVRKRHFYWIRESLFLLGARPFKEMTTYEEYVDETSSKDTDNTPKTLDDMQKKPSE